MKKKAATSIALREELLSLLCPVRRARMVVSSEAFLFNRMTVGDMKGARST